ncbi:MAG: hypothetical protein KVP17_005178, partial [Porospora cf. gigantea B]|uniref:uncharacterized protein n=1 Tax=Porospora cf. gigantea B TaxID=2853592 RepID=UPI003571E8F4
MASSLAVCDLKGKLIISRVYRDIEDVNMEPFLRRVVLCKPDQVANPLFCEDNVTYGWLRHQDVF